MITVDIYNIKGQKVTKMTLPKEVFGVPENDILLAQAVRVWLANQRQIPAKTKHRGEVAYSTRKIYRQKGTGRARHGARSAPIFVKGGTTHGPQGNQNFKLELSQKMKKAALKIGLSGKLRDKEIIILTGLEKIGSKTKEMVTLIKNLIPHRGEKNKKSKISLILPMVWKNVIQAGRNIPYLNLLQVKQLNVYEVLNGGILVFPKDSLEILIKRLK
jgi:large subunit ribosomal protein L4